MIAASPDDVYAALVDAKALLAWLPPTGTTGALNDSTRVPAGRIDLC